MRVLLVVFICCTFMSSCKKNEELKQTVVYTDDGLLGSWVLDSTTYIGGVVIPNPDDQSTLKGTKLFLTFLEDGIIKFSYSSYHGGGEFIYLEDHKIKVTKFSDANIGYPESQFLGEFITRMISVNRYSVKDGTLRLYFNQTTGVMYFSPN